MKQAKEGTYTCIHTCEWCTCTSHLPYVHVCIFKYKYMVMVMVGLVNSVVLSDKWKHFKLYLLHIDTCVTYIFIKTSS